jgi:hypothetical protein
MTLRRSDHGELWLGISNAVRKYLLGIEILGRGHQTPKFRTDRMSALKFGMIYRVAWNVPLNTGLHLTKMWPSLNYGCGLNGNNLRKLQGDGGEVNKPTSRLWAMAPVTPPNKAPVREDAPTQWRTPTCWAYGAEKSFCWVLSIKATVSETGGVVLCSVDVDVLRFCVFRPARRKRTRRVSRTPHFMIQMA